LLLRPPLGSLGRKAVQELADPARHFGKALGHEEDALVVGRVVGRLGDDGRVERPQIGARLEPAQLAKGREQAGTVGLEGRALAADLAKNAAAFRRKSRSIVIVLSSRRSRVFSARSSLVQRISLLVDRRALHPGPHARLRQPQLSCQHARILAAGPISLTTSALYSFVNDLLVLAMDSILHHIGGVHEIVAGSVAPCAGRA